jgi:hypothetical protein
MAIGWSHRDRSKPCSTGTENARSELRAALQQTAPPINSAITPAMSATVHRGCLPLGGASLDLQYKAL